MRYRNKLLIAFLKLVLITIGTAYISFFLYYRFSWRNHYSESQVDNIIASLDSSKALTDSFYYYYDKMYTNRHENITTRYFKNFWREFLIVQYPLQDNWQYVVANMQNYRGERYKRAPIALAFRLNRDVTPERCFDYIMIHRFKEYCDEFRITDTGTILTDREELIKFIVASKNPRYFRSHPNQFQFEVERLKNAMRTI